MKKQNKYIYDELLKMFPDAGCELNYSSVFELTIAVVLSAQTTDVSVNKVTEELFRRYPDAYSLSKAGIKDVEDIIRSIGLYRNKAKNIVLLSQELVKRFDGNVPDNMEDLCSLPGVGRKSSNVILSECFGKEAIAVDTHVERVSKRLGIAEENDSVLKVEEKLNASFDSELWHKLHHLMIHFGRYKCTSRNPDCTDCPFKVFCNYNK